MLGGRGAGKTRLGAEWVRAQVARHARLMPSAARLHIALVGETEHDVREVMIEGPAGLLRVSPRARAAAVDRRRAGGSNGRTARSAYAFSAEDPEQLRGPQFDAAWCDELAKWRYADATFDMLQFGLRLGARPRQLITTTPRPIALIKRLLADPRTAVTRASTHANAAYLSPAFLDEVLARYAGTRLGRQEIDGEIIEDRADALWTRAHDRGRARSRRRRRCCASWSASIRRPRRAPAPDACGIVAAGIAEDGVDLRAGGCERAGRCAPQRWASAAVALFRRLKADAMVAEVNQGGDMVAAVLRQIDRDLPVRTRARDARQMAARRAGGARSTAGQRQARRPADARARGRDVRLRHRRAVVGRLARPARRAGLGGDRAHHARLGRPARPLPRRRPPRVCAVVGGLAVGARKSQPLVPLP